IFAACFGAAIVLAIIIWFSHKVQNNVMLLIIGIMVGYIASSLISILNFNASADKVHQYVMWGMGDFGSVSMDKLPWYVSFCVFGLVGALLLVKPLNALLLGDSYAANLGINVKRSRLAILLTTSLLTATVTAFCGPISFIGLAVPHIARLFLNRSDHRHLLPVTILVGSVIALLCNLLANISTASGSLPLNAITSIVGAPVIIYVIMGRKRLHYFN
ncbi:MAG: iron ABC transporter permease, partial [Bacteroidales bacterium]|nr:iron ABC transporter permease [Bacteroidales bacterium]